MVVGRDMSEDKSKKPLLADLKKLRQRVADLEAGETKRSWEELQNELSLRLLEILNKPGDQREIIREIVFLIKDFSGCDAVGIRLKEGDDFPYYETNGFIEGHVPLENYLCKHDLTGQPIRDEVGNPVLECMCGNIICGRFDLTKPFFTEGGSFWTNSTTELLASTTEQDRQARTRNRCNGEGYESVALIPFKAEEGNLGLLQLNSFQRNRFTSELVQYYEGIAQSIGVVVTRKQTEEALQRERDRAQHYLDIAGVIIVALDMTGNVSLINKKGAEILGYKESEIIGRNWFDNFLPESVGREVHKVFQKLIARELGPVEYYENPVKTKTGEEKLVAWHNSMLGDDEGNIIGTLSSGEDITEQKDMENALIESEEKYRSIFTEARYGIALVDADTGEIADCNQEFERQTGRNLEHLVKMKVWELRPPEKVAAARQKFLEIRRKGRGESEGLEFQKPGGELMHIEFSAKAITIGKKRYLQSMVRDITERKKAEEALHLRAHLLNEATDSIIATDLDGNLLYMNEATCRTRGYSKEEMLNMNVKQLVPPEMAGAVEERLRRVKKKGAIVIESEHVRKDGSVFPVESTARTINLEDRTIVLSVIRDITERKQAEEALRESEEHYRALLELGGRTGEAVVMLQDDERGRGMHVYASDEWALITGYSRDELLNMSLLDLVHPDAREEARERHEKRMHGEVLPGLYEVTIIRKDGSGVPVEGTYAYSSYKGKPANVGYIRNISERKKMEEQLVVTDRLASIGELASGVAHELNNPLTGIIGFSELLLKKNIAEEIKEDLEIINREAQRTAQIVRNLLTFARRHETTKEPVDINQAIKSVLDLRAYEQKVHNIEAVANLDPNLPKITADLFRLQQVFINIIINAEHFMTEAHGRGTLTITTESDGDVIRVSFADDGPGIREENMRHLFDPFFTTKEVGKGTGLGLSICHGIVTEHGGQIYTESELEKGATFTLELPVK